MDGLFVGSSVWSILEIFVAERRRSLRFAIDRRSGAGHNSRFAIGRILRRDSTLVVFHPSAQKRASLGAGGHMALRRRDDYVDPRAGGGSVAVFSVEALSLSGRRIEYSLCRAKTMARVAGSDFRSRHLHLGLQRLVVDGAIFLAEDRKSVV